MRHLVQARGVADQIEVDSCGTGDWHVGESPHRESQRVAKKGGVSLKGQRARQIEGEDFREFDLIVAMDRQNQRDLLSFKSEWSEKVVLLRDFDPKGDNPDVPDPYFGGSKGFERVYEIIDRCCQSLLDDILERNVKR